MSDPLVGTRFAGRFDIERPLAAGGMGAVYVATQQPTGRKVALKVIKHGPDGKGASDPTLVARFQREAETLAAISHPNIVTMFDSGVDDGVFFIVMELLSGQSLRAVLEPKDAPRRALPWSRASRIIGDVLRALSAVHEKGVVHRDLKPDNIFLTSSAGHTDFAKLLDFGIVRASTELSASTPTESHNLTNTGGIIGTPGYLAPEQMRGEGVSARSDLYATGVILYEMVTGVFPFTAPTVQAMAIKQLIDPITPPRRLAPDLSADAERFIVALLDRDPANRPQTADDALAALNAIDAGNAPTLPPMRAATTPSSSTSTSTLPTPSTQAMAFPSGAVAFAPPQPQPQPSTTMGFVARAAAVAGVVGAVALSGAVVYRVANPLQPPDRRSAPVTPTPTPAATTTTTTTTATTVPAVSTIPIAPTPTAPVRAVPANTPTKTPVRALPTTTPSTPTPPTTPTTPATPTTPTTPTPTTPTPPLTPKQVGAPLLRDRAAIRDCFDSDLPAWASFTIQSDGTAVDVEVVSAPGGERARACLARLIKATQWPAGPGQRVLRLPLSRALY